MDIHDIYRAFAHGDLTFREAVIALKRIGESHEDAECIVTEWADDLEGNLL
jgi:hypothetical protein